MDMQHTHMPRTIHDVNDVVLLVSAIYACEMGTGY